MRSTITHAFLLVGLVFFAARTVAAQSDGNSDDPFARHRWHAEIATQGALEAWNYNGSHEELLGLEEGLTYGIRDGLALKLTQRVTYVSQRANDTWVLGLTGGVRGRIYRRGGLSVFLGAELGISDTSIATPPRGTRFNYLAVGGGGILVRLRPRLYAVSSLQLTHLSNDNLKGPGRNPDIEAIGLSLGLTLGF